MSSKRDYLVYRCALKSERMTQVLIRFHNEILKHNHHPKRWLDLVDEILEKGKGQNVNRLRILELIEAETKLLMRTFLGVRIDEEHTMNKRWSKYNYGSKKEFYIKIKIVRENVNFWLCKEWKKKWSAQCQI